LKNSCETIIYSRCNKLNICQVPVHSDILPHVCPDTPKYLEAQYQCVSHIEVAEEVRQRRLPRLGGNISDLWSDRNVMLNDDLVKDALETVIDSQQIPITEEPAKFLTSSDIRVASDESTKVSTMKEISVNSKRSILSLNDTTSLIDTTIKMNQKENTSALPMSLRNASLSDNNSVNKKMQQWETTEVLIIILISSLSVIFIILTAAIILIKVKILLSSI
jgi:hypothetical protein